VTRVLVADDQAAVRAGFAALVAGEEEMEVAGEAGNGREAVDIARRVFPHVVLMDIRMPVLDGVGFANSSASSLGLSGSLGSALLP
jgi:YesN/AraC family two-component response regulator